MGSASVRVNPLFETQGINSIDNAAAMGAEVIASIALNRGAVNETFSAVMGALQETRVNDKTSQDARQMVILEAINALRELDIPEHDIEKIVSADTDLNKARMIDIVLQGVSPTSRGLVEKLYDRKEKEKRDDLEEQRRLLQLAQTSLEPNLRQRLSVAEQNYKSGRSSNAYYNRKETEKRDAFEKQRRLQHLARRVETATDPNSVNWF